MAKAKSGGTRSYIRGRVGADVYSIGKDGLGKKQQVVRSLAETVANPQTEAQMRGRMIMSTIMQFVTGASVIIDHSFDGVVKGQPSISEFIRRNYALIKADVAAHPSADNVFALSPYKEKGAQPGAYVVSDGEAINPGSGIVNEAQTLVAFVIPETTGTMGDLREAAGMTDDDYVTFIGVGGTVNTYGEVLYKRVRLNPAIADSTVLTSENIASAFLFEGNGTIEIGFDGGEIDLQFRYSNGAAVIWSIKGADGYKHSSATLVVDTIPADTNADAVLPTYPQGGELFLNGGDI